MIRKARKGTALVRDGIGGARVSFGALISLPVLHRVTVYDISVQKFELAFLESNGLSCRDRIKADLRFVFFVAPKKTGQDILNIHRTFGSRIVGNPKELKVLFDAKFTESIKICIRGFEFTELFDDRDKFREMVLEKIGDDLLGFIIEDCVIDHLEQTALEFHDPNSILDSEGIKKITEQTAAAEMESRKIQREKEKREAIERAKLK